MATKTNCKINGTKYCRKTKTVGRKLDGTPIKKQFYGKSEKDVDEQIESYMNMLKRGVPTGFEKITIEELMHTWLFDILLPSKNTKSSSFEKHESNYRLYIKASDISYLTVHDICTQPIQNFYNKLYNEKGLSSDKIFDINKTLRKFFSWCLKSHYISENPCSLNSIDIPGNADGEEDEAEDEMEGNHISVFTDEELEVILKNVEYESQKDNTFNILTYLDFLTGMRKGELLGLKKKFVNLNNCKIKVRNTLKLVKVFDSPTQFHRELKLIKPKTKSSIRDVDFPASFKPVLELYLKEQEQKWKDNGLKFDDDCLIFTTSSCLPIDFSNHTRAWERFLKRIKIGYKKPHSIRDTYATLLFRKGASLTDVRDLLGHSTISTTEKYYLYVFPSDKKEAANLLNFLITKNT